MGAATQLDNQQLHASHIPAPLICFVNNAVGCLQFLLPPPRHVIVPTVHERAVAFQVKLFKVTKHKRLRVIF